MKIRKLPTLLQFFLLYIVIVAVGFAAIVLVYALPTEKIQENVDRSDAIFGFEGIDNSYRVIYNGDVSCILDNLTDHLMLARAAESSGDSPVEAAMSTYSWYWHGYLVFLKPLLIFFTYYNIRELMTTVQIGLTIAIAGLMGRKGELRYAVPMLAAWIFLNPITLSMSLQFNTVFVLTMLTLLVCVIFSEKLTGSLKNAALLFFVVGCLTSYFDFLTYPLVTLGVPASYIVAKEDFTKLKKAIVFIAVLSFSWGCGYAMMWATKWVLSSLIVDTAILKDTIEHVLFRAGVKQQISYIGIIRRTTSVNTFQIYAAVISAFVGIAVCLLRCRKMPAAVLPLLITAVMPFAWYFVTKNHSYLHFFTYRELAITVFSLWTIAVLGFFNNRNVIPQIDRTIADQTEQ